LERESMQKPTVVEQKSIPISTFLISILARNFYRFMLGAPILALIINFLLLLLFYRTEKRGPNAGGVAEEVAIGTSFVTLLTDAISSIADSFKTRKSTWD
uniref:RR_TM4-6 domain-containing protein n=1 Tax=Taenia asiatica TaxID=60517 RepID=A0A0R3VZZ4_TAEAS